MSDYNKIFLSSLVLLLLIVALIPVQVVAKNKSPTSYQEAEQQLTRVMALVEELREQIDRSQFDLEALLENLDYDADTIIGFVKQSVVFQQYPGLLRGAKGTLISRAGNALDQSLLLATLLNDAGYEAKMVRGNLPRELAYQLLLQIEVPLLEKKVLWQDVEVVAGILKRISLLTGADLDAFGDIDKLLTNDDTQILSALPPLHQQVELETQFVHDQLKKADLTLSKHAITNSLIEEAQDYFWVLYRLGANDEWQSVHPVFNEILSLDLEVLEIFTDTLPSELQHRLQLQAWVETKQGKQRIVQPVMSPWENATANLIGEVIEFTTVPDSITTLSANTSQSVSELRNTMFNRMTYFVPLLNNRPAPDAKAFDIQGRVIDLGSRSQAAAGLFAEIGDQFANSIAALKQDKQNDSLTEDETITGLTAYWIEYTFISPAGQQHTHKRYIVGGDSLDFHGSNSLTVEEKTAQLKLLSAYSLALATGTLNDAYVLDQVLAALIASEANLLLHFAGMLAEEKKAELALPWSGHALLYRLFDLGSQTRTTKGTDINYRANPALLVYSRTWDSLSEMREIIDIVVNKQRFLTIDNNQFFVNTKAALRHGIWETYAEPLILGLPATTPLATAGIFQKARQEKTTVLALKADQIDKIKNLPVPVTAKVNLQRDLTNGYTVIVPLFANSETNTEPLAWWRVKPDTGETLGVLATGQGGAQAVEYKGTTLFDKFIVATGVGIMTFQACITATAIHAYARGYADRVRSNTRATAGDVIKQKMFSCVGFAVAGFGAILSSAVVTVTATIIAVADWSQLDPPDKCPKGYICTKR